MEALFRNDLLQFFKDFDPAILDDEQLLGDDGLFEDDGVGGTSSGEALGREQDDFTLVKN